MKKVLSVMFVIAQMVLISTANAQSGGRLNGAVGFEGKAITTAMDTTTITSSNYVPIYGYVKLDSAGVDDVLYVFRENDTLTTKGLGYIKAGAWIEFTGEYIKKLKIRMKTGTGKVTMSVH